jgi:hypothetical protein
MKKKKKTKKEELSLSDKFDELPWWVIPIIFVIIITILELTTELGVGYYFFALLGAGIIFWVISVIIALFGKSNF